MVVVIVSVAVCYIVQTSVQAPPRPCPPPALPSNCKFSFLSIKISIPGLLQPVARCGIGCQMRAILTKV